MNAHRRLDRVMWRIAANLYQEADADQNKACWTYAELKSEGEQAQLDIRNAGETHEDIDFVFE